MSVSANLSFHSQLDPRLKESSAWKWRLSCVLIIVVGIFVLSWLLDPSTAGVPWSFVEHAFGVWEARGRVLIFLIAFGLATFYAAGVLQQLYKVEDHSETRWHLIDMLFGLSYLLSGMLGMVSVPLPLPVYIVARGGKIDPDDQKRAAVKIGGPALLVIYEDTAVVLERDGKFTRVAGPGFKRVAPFETVREVVDLRRQIRQEIVRGLTRDGIPILLSVEIECQIKPWSFSPGDKDVTLPKTPYPFREMDIRRAVYEKIVANGVALRWNEVIYFLAKVHLRRLLRQRTLDKLIEPEEGNPQNPLTWETSPRWRLQTELHQILQPRAHQFGAAVLRVTLGAVQPEDVAGIREKIEKERVEVWQAEWKRRSLLIQKETDAEVARLKEVARAQAQAAMLKAIADSLPLNMEQAAAQKVIALRLLESLEEMALDPFASVPDETIRTLRSFHQVLETRAL